MNNPLTISALPAVLRPLIVCIGSLLLAACGPVFTVPGGALSGTEREPPADWQSSRQFETVQLQTDPSDPYSVNVWGVDIGADFFVAASSGANSNWAQNIAADPAVVLRLGEDLFALTAVHVEDPAVIAMVETRYIEKYDLDADDNFIGESWVFRLDRRP